jgi:hypothetical protein
VGKSGRDLDGDPVDLLLHRLGLPVWMLLQPRDYVNSHQLMVALGLLVLGVVVVG